MRIFFRIVLALVLIGMVVGLGAGVYNAGVTQGLAAGGKLVLPDGATGVAPYAYYGLHRPFGFGFGFGIFGLIFPLLFLFLIFGAIRGLFFRSWRGHGPWSWGPRGFHGDQAPPQVEELHRRMHEKMNQPPTSQA
jgi:hypothetical protein